MKKLLHFFFSLFSGGKQSAPQHHDEYENDSDSRTAAIACELEASRG